MQSVRRFVESREHACPFAVEAEHAGGVQFEAVMKKAIDYFTEAGAAMIQTYNPGATRTQIKQFAKQDFRAHLEDPDSDIIPHIVHPSRGGLYTVFMGQYKRPHPRWAPHPMLVMTWISDVEQAQAESPRVVELIRERVFREFGEPYDAKAVILPQRPEID